MVNNLHRATRDQRRSLQRPLQFEPELREHLPRGRERQDDLTVRSGPGIVFLSVCVV